MANGGKGRIVVGVDGSDSSTLALRWALEQAHRTGFGVDVVTCWQHPSAYGWETFDIATDFGSVARDRLDDTLRGVSHDGIDLRRRVLEGPPAWTLIDAAAGAELLVVGSRGHGAFAGMLLGSVSQHCVQHARCPVVVVRGEPDAPSAAA